MLCDAQIRNERRYIILSSIVKIHNNTTMPLIILNINSVDTKEYEKIAKIEINDEYSIPIDLLYAHLSSLIFIGIDE
jgi:hypothetical protein